MRTFLRQVLVLASAILISGCAATVTSGSAESSNDGTKAGTGAALVTTASPNIVFEVAATDEIRQSPDFGQMAEALKSAMRAQSTQSNAVLSLTPNDTAPAAGTRVVLTLTDYRMVSGGARFALGIMTGNAFIIANADFFDLGSGNLLGKRTYNTSSSAWQGVFAPTTDKQTNAMAAAIVKDINPRQ
jgi:hypothetical protein